MTYVPASEEIPADETEPPQRRVRVQVTNETDAPVDGARLEAAVRAALQHAEARAASVSVAVVDDATIHELNRRFLQHDYPTDVLSFVLEDDGERLEGEIIVSRDTAEASAAEAGWSAADELLLYVVHGALHLAGYCDKTPDEAAAMRAAEAATLKQIGVAPSAEDSRWRPLEGHERPLEAQNS